MAEEKKVWVTSDFSAEVNARERAWPSTAGNGGTGGWSTFHEAKSFSSLAFISARKNRRTPRA